MLLADVLQILFHGDGAVQLNFLCIDVAQDQKNNLALSLD